MNNLSLGEKIRTLRKQQNLTQSDLAGEFITRNMLSRIENGSATPSIESLCYIARRLDISPGWLLDEETPIIKYEKSKHIESIKKLFIENNYISCELECRKLLENESEDELSIIAAECSYRLAFDFLKSGKLNSAQNWYKKSLDYINNCSINIISLATELKEYSEYIKLIYSNSQLRGNYKECIMPDKLPRYEGALCLKLNIMIQKGDSDAAQLLLSKEDITGEYAKQIKASLAFTSGEINIAEELYRELIKNNILPVEINFIAASELENIARRKENYKLAYICAEKKLELIAQAAK
jgi:Predicted transcription factor, homolog of eukaryotic MBF1